jgi:hypothetical protein
MQPTHHKLSALRAYNFPKLDIPRILFTESHTVQYLHQKFRECQVGGGVGIRSIIVLNEGWIFFPPREVAFVKCIGGSKRVFEQSRAMGEGLII